MKLNRIPIVTLYFCLLASVVLGQQGMQSDFLNQAIDRSVNPGENFFKFATGKWMKENPIPSTERGWSIGNLVQEETYTRLHTLLEDAAKGTAPAGSKEQKIGDFYASGMDTATIDRIGLSALSNELSLIGKISDRTSLLAAAAELQKLSVDAMFSIFVDQDAKNSDAWALYIYQGGLGLPLREYYFSEDARNQNIRKEYKTHIANILRLSGDDSAMAATNAAIIYKIELFLADSSRKLEDLRDPYANYNKLSMSELAELTPAVNWSTINTRLGIKKIDSVIVGQPEFFRQLNAAVNAFSIEEWKEYLKWHLIIAYADRIGSSFEKERFHFKGTVMSGVKEQRPRWKRMQDAVENAMGELLGQIYVAKYYSPATKKRYEKLVDDIVQAYRERLLKLDWMSDVTKEKAIAKLNAINRKVGYPDKWKDFSSLEVSRVSFAQNTMNANLFWFRKNIERLGTPVDRSEWNMTPQTYNAYYNPSNNEIVLPAACFIIPGVPDSLLDDAIIYSYAGASTIGHELTHGFDDQGRQFDLKGNLADWWTKEDETKFTSRAQGIIDQFNSYVVLDSMHVNGKASQGENIADLGGIVIGYDAFMKTKQFKEGKLIDGFTPAQRFWLGYAYSWLGHKRDEALAQQIMTDVHAPEFLRVNGPLSNIPAFYDAFGIKEGQAMYRPDSKRVKIW
jgi:putative endopeptidase